MRPHGSDLMNRTNHPAFDAAPDWQTLDDDDDDDDDEGRRLDTRADIALSRENQ